MDLSSPAGAGMARSPATGGAESQIERKMMIRNLKTLGLALFAVLALTAVAASAASAQQGKLTSEKGVPFTLTGTETTGEGETNALTAFGLTIECPGSTYTGHEVKTTAHKLIPNGAIDATITPHYKQANHNCRVQGLNLPVTVDMNKCDYVAHLGVTTGGVAGTYGVTFDIECNAVGEDITVTVWTTNALETSEPNNPMCIIHVPQQTGLKGAHARDTGNGHVDLIGTVEGIKAVKTKTTHAVLCPAAETTVGKFDIAVTGAAHVEGGASTKISISE